MVLIRDANTNSTQQQQPKPLPHSSAVSSPTNECPRSRSPSTAPSSTGDGGLLSPSDDDRKSTPLAAESRQTLALQSSLSGANNHPLLSLSVEEDPEFKQFAYPDDTPEPSSPQVDQVNVEQRLLGHAEDLLSSDELLNTTDVATYRQPLGENKQRDDSDQTATAQTTTSGSDIVASSKHTDRECLFSAQVSSNNKLSSPPSTTTIPIDCDAQTIELRFLVRRREAGALIGKRGTNIKRLRESFRSSMFSIPDTGNGPERVVCIVTNEKSMDSILADFTQLLMEKSPEYDEQIELKFLIHSSHAGSIIGIGGQSIKKLRNDSKAAIKIYEMCCPLSNERVCAIKAKPPVVVSTIKLIQSILNENPIKGTMKPYDALHFDLNLVEKYGGYLPDDVLDMMSNHSHAYDPTLAYSRQVHDGGYSAKHYNVWRSSEFRENSCDIHEAHDVHSHNSADSGSSARHLEHQHGIPVLQSGVSQPEMTGGGGTQSRPSNGGGGYAGDHSGVVMKRDVADCGDESSKVTQMTVYPARPGRFHPYAQVLSAGAGPNHYQHQLEFSSCNRQPVTRHHLPVGAYTGRLQHYGSIQQQHHQQQQRGQFIRMPNAFSNLHERCRHARPCLCMLLPVVPDVLSASPYVQLAKNFNHSRSSTHGYKKK